MGFRKEGLGLASTCRPLLRRVGVAETAWPGMLNLSQQCDASGS
jgi:hypothetical protein